MTILAIRSTLHISGPLSIPCCFHEALGVGKLLVFLRVFVAPRGVDGAAVMVVVLVGGFCLSVKGSSILSTVQEC